MEYIIYYIEIGIIANATAFLLNIIMGIYLVATIGIVELKKLANTTREEGVEYNFSSLLHFFIPFFVVYLVIVEFLLIKKYFNSTAESIRFIIKELDKYKIFKRFRWV